jgi:hypothetical protein
LRVLLTETGVDGGVTNRPGHQGGGWADFRDTPDPQLGDYEKQRRWYAWQVSHDPYVVGLTSFGECSADPTWHSFSLLHDTGMTDKIIAAEADLPDWHFGATPPPPEVKPVADKMSEILAAEFGAAYHDYRAELPANPAGPYGPFGPMGAVRGIAVHHTAGPKGQTWSAVAQYHVTGRGWAGIGYHIGIRQGAVGYLGDVRTARAHVTDQNNTLVGVVLTGNYMTEALDARDAALLPRVVACIDRYLGRQVPVQGHGTWQPNHTVCPGAGLAAAVANVRGAGGGAAGSDLASALRKWSDLAQARGIQPNPQAALFKAATAAGFYPLTDESGARGVVPPVEGFDVVAQVYRKWGGAEERIYYYQAGQVKWVTR